MDILNWIIKGVFYLGCAVVIWHILCRVGWGFYFRKEKKEPVRRPIWPPAPQGGSGRVNINVVNSTSTAEGRHAGNAVDPPWVIDDTVIDSYMPMSRHATSTVWIDEGIRLDKKEEKKKKKPKPTLRLIKK